MTQDRCDAPTGSLRRSTIDPRGSERLGFARLRGVRRGQTRELAGQTVESSSFSVSESGATGSSSDTEKLSSRLPCARVLGWRIMRKRLHAGGDGTNLENLLPAHTRVFESCARNLRLAHVRVEIVPARTHARKGVRGRNAPSLISSAGHSHYRNLGVSLMDGMVAPRAPSATVRVAVGGSSGRIKRVTPLAEQGR